MLFAYLPVIVFENFTRLAIATLQMMPMSRVAANDKSAEPTIILME